LIFIVDFFEPEA